MRLRAGARGSSRPRERDGHDGHDARQKLLVAGFDHFRVVFENAPIGVALLTPDGRFALVNRALTELLGFAPDELTRLALTEVMHPDDVAAHGKVTANLAYGWERTVERRLVRADGTTVWVALTNELVRDGEIPLYVVAHVEDITQRRETERALREAEERFRRAFEDSPIGMALVATDGQFLRVNRTLCEITGFADAELLERTFQDITHPEDLAEDVDQVERAVNGEIRTYGMEKRYVRPDGEIVWVRLSVTLVRDDDGSPLYFVSEVEDVGERKRSQLELQRLANFDPLTGLGNRRKLTADLEEALALPETAVPHMLIIFDLNGFKHYNDTFGHPAGDALLARLATQLAEAAATHGEAYRLGGDEFCVLGAPPPGEAESYVSATVTALEEEGAGFAVSASFGAAILPEEAQTASAALTVADRRLYAQKHLAQAERGRPHDVLLLALREREPTLGDHCANVAELATAVGERLALPESELDELRRAAELHDIGKLAMPDAVLRKQGPLTQGEWSLMRSHTLIGERILASSPALGPVGSIVRSTHERWDGSGYPDGLAGEAIPRSARIIAVCDAYTAMASGRPYQLARSTRSALDELRSGGGTQFDPEVVAALCDEVRSRDDRAGVSA